MQKRKAWAIATAALMVFAGGTALFWFHRPARSDFTLLGLLPPDADLYLVADLRSLRSNPVLMKLLSDPPGFHHDEDYDQFVQSTGFHYQDDLEELAAAKLGDDWVGAARVALDRGRLVAYLESRRAETTRQEGQAVYTFGTVRPLRLALTRKDLILFSVGADPQGMGRALQRYNKSLADSGLSDLQRMNEIQHIPPGSGLWIVGRAERLLAATGYQPQLGSLTLSKDMLQGSKTLYVTVTSAPLALDLQAEDLCDSEPSAARIANLSQGILTILRTVPSNSQNNGNADFSAVLAGVSIQQAGQSVYLRWQGNKSMFSLLERLLP